MNVSIAPKWKVWIGQHLFGLGIIFAGLGWGILFFGESNTFAAILLTIGIIPLILSVVLIRNNFEEYMKDPQF